MGVWKIFGTHLGGLWSMSLSYRSRTQFTLFPQYVRTTHLITTKLGRYIPLIMLPTWLNFGGNLVLVNLFEKFQIRSSQVENSICHIIVMVGPIDVKQKEMSRLDATLTRVPLTLTFDLEFSRSNCISGMGGPIAMEWKGQGSMSWCETLRKWVNWMLGWLGYPWPWPLTFKVKLYLGIWRPDCHGTKGTGDDRMPWCETQPLCDLQAQDIVRDRGDLGCHRFCRLV